MTKTTRKNVYYVTDGKCFYCGCDLNFYDFHVDHLKPKSSGGVDKNNRVPACPDCNLVKTNKSIEEFRKTIEDYVYNDVNVRMIDKYMGIKKKRVKFYFESGNFSPY